MQQRLIDSVKPLDPHDFENKLKKLLRASKEDQWLNLGDLQKMSEQQRT